MCSFVIKCRKYEGGNEMGYKRFSIAEEVEEMLRRAEDREYNNKSDMYNILKQIKSEWRGKYYAERAQYLLETEFKEFNP